MEAHFWGEKALFGLVFSLGRFGALMLVFSRPLFGAKNAHFGGVFFPALFPLWGMNETRSQNHPNWSKGFIGGNK